MMNGYICFYKGKQCEVYAKTSYEAQQAAAKQFKAKKSYEVTVMLAEKGPVDGNLIELRLVQLKKDLDRLQADIEQDVPRKYLGFSFSMVKQSFEELRTLVKNS